MGGQSWNDFQKVVDGHATNVLHAANSQMSALEGDYWQEVEFYGLVRQMNSDALRRIDSIRVFLGREGGRLNHNFTPRSFSRPGVNFTENRQNDVNFRVSRPPHGRNFFSLIILLFAVQ